MVKRNRRVGSLKQELIKKSREAMLCAVQIFNNPIVVFKSEVFIVLSIIAWTYLLHAYYKEQGIDYRYYDKTPRGMKRFAKTKNGAYKNWELERCLNDNSCPIDNDTKNNLKFLIGLRHEIEHQMTTKIDDFLSARYQACCLNFNKYIKQFFSENNSIDKILSFSLQFSSLSEEQVGLLNDYKNTPINIVQFVNNFDNLLSKEEFDSPIFSYRVLLVEKTANRKGQADKVIEFVKAGSELADNINESYKLKYLIKDIEKPKYRASQIVDTMKSEGYPTFTMHKHTIIWKEIGGKIPSKGYGVDVVGTWYWYSNWFDVVRTYLSEHKELF